MIFEYDKEYNGHQVVKESGAKDADSWWKGFTGFKLEKARKSI